jgi:hypothetical protein
MRPNVPLYQQPSHPLARTPVVLRDRRDRRPFDQLRLTAGGGALRRDGASHADQSFKGAPASGAALGEPCNLPSGWFSLATLDTELLLDIFYPSEQII